MNNTESAYGLWSLVIINSAIFIMFAFSFFKPATARDWRVCRILCKRTIHRRRKPACP